MSTEEQTATPSPAKGLAETVAGAVVGGVASAAVGAVVAKVAGGGDTPEPSKD